MVALTDKPGVAIRVEDDGRAATVALGPTPRAQTLTPEQVLEAMNAAGLAALSHWAQALADGLARHRAAPDQRVTIELPATEPRTGTDGHVLWRDGCDPTAARLQAAGADGERVDFYNQSRFVFVAAGQVLGTLVEPVPGQPGVDVRGRAIEPANPQPAAVNIADGAAVDAAGQITAQVDGVVHFEHNTVRVEPALMIDGDVDFNTGNISFKGDVRITGSVRDLFKVASRQSVEVGGTVEAAHITTAGSLTITGGVAGKEKGWLEVGQDLAARYLNRARGRVAGHVWVAREIDHTHIAVAGGIQAADGRIVGGRVTLGGDSTIGELGSPQGQHTIIHLGFSPNLERQADRILAIMARFRRRARRRKKALQKLHHGGDAHALRIAALKRELDILRHRRECWAAALQRTRDQLARIATAVLRVERTLHPGVTIVTPRARATVTRQHPGPLVLGLMSEPAVGIKRSGRTTYERLTSI